MNLIPPDGFTVEEQQIIETITVDHIYKKLPTSRMKAIVAMHFELGYPQEWVADIFKVSQEQIALDIRNIREILLGRKVHEPRGNNFETASFLLLITKTLAYKNGDKKLR